MISLVDELYWEGEKKVYRDTPSIYKHSTSELDNMIELTEWGEVLHIT